MGRYRKVEVKTWGDASFKKLTPIPPCGQGLWFYLMTGPRTTAIPGLFAAGPATMAEDLDWEPEAFREAFREALSEGMVKADFKAKLVFLPKAIEYNKPESPNVVKSWANEFEILPECDLKIEAYETLKSFICGLSEAFAKAFSESFVKPSFKPSAKPSLKAIANQEQEQEQKQKQYLKPTSEKKFTDDHMKFAEGMLSLIRQVAPSTKKPNLEKWANDIRLINEIDKRPLEEMAEVFRFANRDEFWRTNILSPGKFREKYAALHAKMLSASHSNTQPRVNQSNVAAFQRFLDQEEQEAS